MADEYKSNSHKSNEVDERKKVGKVVKGKVKTKKKSGITKFTDVFISEDVSSVKSYIIGEVLIPAMKKALSDIVTNGIDMILYGESGVNKRFYYFFSTFIIYSVFTFITNSCYSFNVFHNLLFIDFI